MEAQRAALQRNSESELIKAGDKRLEPRADAALKPKFETRPLKGVGIAPAHSRILGLSVVASQCYDAGSSCAVPGFSVMKC